jgi:peroxiredoxin
MGFFATLFTTFLGLTLVSLTPFTTDAKAEAKVQVKKNMSLTEQLQSKADASKAKSPKEVKAIMAKAIADLKASDVMKKALKKGDQIPEFSLEDINKGKVNSKDLLKKGPLVISFYRGGWCPYCNLQLRSLQTHLADIKKTGANLVAISPEAPDQTAETIKKQELGFYVLSDTEGKVAQSFGLTFALSKDLKKLYQKFGIELDKHNANKKWELPLSATYIVSKKGKIIYSFVDADYKKRAETSDLVRILDSIK